jgi:hypothetical protein
MMESFFAELRALEEGRVISFDSTIMVRGLVTVIMEEIARHMPEGDPAEHLSAMLSSDDNELHISLVAKTTEGKRVLDLLTST